MTIIQKLLLVHAMELKHNSENTQVSYFLTYHLTVIDRALRSVIIVSLQSFNSIFFAYFNHENNRYNRIVKP